MTQRAPRRRQAIKISQQNLSRSTFRVFDELPERRRNVALRRARDLDDGLGLGVVALGLAARERGDHGVFVFLSNKGKKQKGKKSLPVFHSFVSLSFFVCTPLSFSLSLSREERDNRRGGRRSISLPLSRSLLSPITSF